MKSLTYEIFKYEHTKIINSIHKICVKLWFCEKEPSEADKIKKTL